ncbi:uncharacterized protein LOC106665007 [Cimex lectularius]|uniref:Protein sleepless n=1 Tax=Cimex lectularius TaxID=79782 RepID=A0A8I6RK48_CIMLE|nr:uncharacterized protein LOC106665007 [Cimex lectularius]
MQATTAILFVCLVATIQSSFALKCYMCDSLVNKKCHEAESLSDKEATECNNEIINKVADFAGSLFGGGEKNTKLDFSCAKVVKTNGDVTRSCVIGKESDWCSKMKDANAVKSCQFCTGDLCNAGTTFHATAGIILASAAVLIGRYM